MATEWFVQPVPEVRFTALVDLMVAKKFERKITYMAM
jgi:hypothetical protein